MEPRQADANGRRAHWSRKLRLTLLLLTIWFVAGPVMGILLVEPLNAFRIGGVPFGFWMGQQGAIYVFILLIFAYAVLSARLDERAHREASEPEPFGRD